jgi:hypothetical protein
VEPGIPLPLGESELAELYETNKIVSVEDEAELQATLPDPQKILSAAEFTSLVQERAQLASLDFNNRADLWDGAGSFQHISTLEGISTTLRRLSTHISALEGWQTAATLAGKHGGIRRKPWDALLAQVDETWNAASNFQGLLIQYAPKLPQDLSPEEALTVSSQISEYFKQNGAISFLTLLTPNGQNTRTALKSESCDDGISHEKQQSLGSSAGRMVKIFMRRGCSTGVSCQGVLDSGCHVADRAQAEKGRSKYSNALRDHGLL